MKKIPHASLFLLHSTFYILKIEEKDMFEPKILAFFCKWCTSAGADLAGTSRMRYSPNVVGIRVMCSSRVDPHHILNAFKNGADGVLVGGCHPGDCHYQTGNYQTLKRIFLMKQMMKELGINEKRLRLEWISAAEGKKFTEVVDEFTEEIRKLGELKKESFCLATKKQRHKEY